MKAIVFGFILSILIGSCYQKNKGTGKEEIWGMMKSGNRDSIIDAILEIKSAKDTSMVDALLYNPYDPRITHRLSYYGMSIYQLKMLTLRDITGIKPPAEITYNPDSTVINYFKRKLDR